MNNSHIRISLVILFGISIFSAFSCGTPPSDNACAEEEFTFPGFDNGILHGTLSVPANYNANKKVVILVSPPSPSDRNYSGFFKGLADSLCRSGIAVLRFDNRSLIYKNTAHEHDVDMFDQASDVHRAIEAIQNDKRFANAKIGLLGHSEGGCSVAIEASRNKKVSFIIVLSTIGIKGDDLMYAQMTNPIKSLGDSITDQFKLIFSEMKKHIAIVSNDINIDSMNSLLRKQMVERSINHAELMGTNSLEKHFYYDSLFWLNRHRVAYIQYNPTLYYSNITCPVLAMCGDADELIDYESNLDGIKTIFTSVNKKNYTIKALKNVDHEYKLRTHSKYDLPFMDRAPNKKQPEYKSSKEMFDIVSAWILRN